MYAGKERRNRMVALVVTVVLLAGVVLALLATVVQASPAPALPVHTSFASIGPADGAIAPGPAKVRLIRGGRG